MVAMELSEITKKHKLLWALNKIPDDLDEQDKIIYALVEEMANDCNSSFFREDVTKWLIGRKASSGKHGYDDDELPIEVKPKNYTGKAKLNGGGSFNDFTWKRDKKYHEDGVVMVVSGFVYGKPVFVVEFTYDDIRDKIQTALNKQLPEGDVPNIYVRSTSFSYLNWKDSSFNLRFLVPDLENYKKYMVGGLYNTLRMVNGKG